MRRSLGTIYLTALATVVLTLVSARSASANSCVGLSLSADHDIHGCRKFDFDYAKIKDQASGVVRADMISLNIAALDLTDRQFTSFPIHFCTASGTDCGPKTGFAESGPVSTVPESGTLALALLGIGVLGLARLAHR